jgi:short-subunit dehydrogenase
LYAILDQKVVVITGAGSGLGASLAKKYSKQGYHVCLVGRTKEKLEKVAIQLTSSYSIYELDVTKKNLVATVFQTILSDLGSIDVLINNAGTGAFDLVENLEEDLVHQMIDINLKGTIFCTQEILGQMKKKNNGTIINVISTAGLVGKANESVYCASKYGVRGFTESLVVELKDTGVKLFAAYMGGMNTDFWNGILPEERTEKMMDPEDIADIIFENTKARKNLMIPEIIIKNIR